MSGTILEKATQWKYDTFRLRIANTSIIAKSPTNTLNKAKVTYTGSPQDNTQWEFWLSADGGLNFEESTVGEYLTFGYVGSELVCRVKGTENSGNYLTKLNVEYEYD